MTLKAALRVSAAMFALLCATAPPAQAAAQAPGPDVLRLPFPQYDGGLTPYTFELGHPLLMLVYDSLMWRDAEGVAQPWLARSVQRSRGGRRLTVRLRSDARWHDGRRVTAADVAFTFNLLRRRSQPRFTPQLVDVERVTATGPLTATFDLLRPAAGFEDQPLADVPIMPSHLWRDLPAGRRAPAGLAVGSGPYRLASARRAGGYVLRANTAYFRGSPQVRELRVPIIDDAEETFEALRERRVDMVPLSLPRGVAGGLGGSLGIAVARGPAYAGTALVLNTRRAPFADAAARRAVAASLDLRRITRNVAPAVPALGGFVHPASRWAAGAPVHRVDVPAARAAVADLGLAPLRVLAPDSDPVRAEAGRQVVLALQRAGASATLVEVSPRALSRALGETGGRPDFDAAITSIPPLVSHDPDYLRNMFGSDPRTAPLNVSGYRSAEFDAVARRVATATDREVRARAILAEARLLARAAPSIPLFFSNGAFAYRSQIYNGWTYIKGTGIFDKRSFLPGETPARGASRGGADPPPVAEDGDSGLALDIVSIISLLALGGVAVLAVLALRQRRRPR
ncbi:MAG: ABC transporter substrate-binding protein [Solirubrobacteraceae bacterium]|nr:ABC transporter substrate-binding protein [Solirubrobacteraceae bacterium]